MNSYINQIFYKCNKFDTKNIYLLEKYMLMKNNLFIRSPTVIYNNFISVEEPEERIYNNNNIINNNTLKPTLVPDFPYGKSGECNHLKNTVCATGITDGVLEDKIILSITRVGCLMKIDKKDVVKIENELLPVKPECINKHNNIWFPSNNDSLFWSMYIGVYELKEYNLIN